MKFAYTLNKQLDATICIYRILYNGYHTADMVYANMNKIMHCEFKQFGTSSIFFGTCLKTKKVFQHFTLAESKQVICARTQLHEVNK